MQHDNRHMNQKGFTLVEVIVALVIVAILAAIAIPSMTGWIDKAREKSAIADCRACVAAAQTIASGQYAEGSVDVTEAEVLDIARVGGRVSYIGIAPPAFVDVLTFTDSKGVTITYLRRPRPHYVFGAGSADASLSALGGTFDLLKNGTLTNSNGQPFNYNGGARIDGVNSGTDGTFAKAMFDAMPPAQQAFLSTVSWSIMKTTNYGYRIYFTEQNYGTGSAKPVKVYKYNMETGKYQYVTNGEVINGEVKATGNPWSEWSDTMD